MVVIPIQTLVVIILPTIQGAPNLDNSSSSDRFGSGGGGSSLF